MQRCTVVASRYSVKGDLMAKAERHVNKDCLSIQP